MAPSCQIPWAILHQIFVKWNHTRLPEDVQNQQRSQDMTMIHRVLILNIILVLAHGDTDEIRPSDMDSKWLYMLAFGPVYLVCQMYIWLYIHIYNPTSHPSLLGHIVDRVILTWFSHFRLHSSSLTGVAVSPRFKFWFDIWIFSWILLLIYTHWRNHSCHPTEWSHNLGPFTQKLFITVIDILITRIVLE